MNVQFPAQTVRATVIGAGAHTLSLSGSTIWLEGFSSRCAICRWRSRLMKPIC
jgi:ethanolamine utilization protein EutA